MEDFFVENYVRSNSIAIIFSAYWLFIRLHWISIVSNGIRNANNGYSNMVIYNLSISNKETNSIKARNK